MNITRHVEQLQNQLTAAAAAGDDTTRDVAERLVTALEPAARVTILDALTDASAELTSAIAPAVIDVRLRGRDIDFVVDGLPAPRGDEDDATIAQPGAEQAAADVPVDLDDASTSRTTLRLPDSIKARAEQAAKAEGISLNAWLVRAVAAGLDTRGTERTRTSRISGWMR
ncbi:toxin-antitoxin system HicB family antitoxin [Brevibacterium sp. W7.2]|uniref:toxin-antitoxin system HicB family antitoxin n=1 Tax=Brevibacterium sp. W7.2 TaxID=2823518 RepID=UPI001BA5FEFB|nr:toxin-antitoxin system HicB family antitoxin [Brevibacterium sp. W7.2]